MNMGIQANKIVKAPDDRAQAYSFIEKNRIHYDSITAFWEKAVGEHFHFGIYDGDASRTAAEELTHEMAKRVSPGKEDKVLDVGCGVGAGAALLAKCFGTRVTGISTSKVGIEKAEQKAAEENLKHLLTFQQLDATREPLELSGFDIAFIQESSHLMPDKLPLFRNMYRTLKPGGRLALCDFFLGDTVNVSDPGFLSMLKPLCKAFGFLFAEQPRNYHAYLENCGFGSVHYDDVTSRTAGTIQTWRNNALALSGKKRYSPEVVSDFLTSLDVLDALFDCGKITYGIFDARKI